MKDKLTIATTILRMAIKAGF